MLVNEGRSYQVHVAEIVEPEAVDGGRESGELVVGEGTIRAPHGATQSRQDPAIHQSTRTRLRTGGLD